MARTTKIPTYDRQVGMSDQGVRGLSGGEIAQASDTGLESLGRGVSNLGGNLAAIEKDRMRKEATLWVSENYETLHQEYTKKEQELQDSDETLDGKGFVTKSLNEFQKLADEKLKSAPSKMAGESWKQQMNQYKMSAFNSAIKYESSKRLEYQKSSLIKTGNAMALRYAADPTLWNEISGSFGNILEGLKDSPETEAIEGYSNLWNKSTLKAAKEKGLANIAEIGLNAIIDEGDKAKIEFIKAQIESGTFDKIIEPDKLLALKNKANGIANAIDKEKKRLFEVDQEDNINEMAENGTVKVELSEAEFKYYYGDNNANWGDYNRKLTFAKKIYAGMTALSTMNPKDMDDYIAKLPTKSKDEKDIRDALIERKNNMIKLMSADPILYAQRFRKDIAKKLEDKDNAAEYQQGLFQLKEMQKNFGIAENNIVLLSDAERESIVNTITSPDVVDKDTLQAIMINYKQVFGGYFDDMIKELVVSGKLEPTLAASMQYVNDLDFGQIFIAARTPVAKDAIAQTDRNDIKKEVQSAFIPIREALTKYNTNAIPMVDGWQALIEKAIVVEMSKDPSSGYSKAADKIIKQFIDSKYAIADSYIVPRLNPNDGYEGADYEQVTNKYIEVLQKPDVDVEILLSGMPTIDAYGKNTGKFKSVQKAALKGNTVWRNTADGKGVELVWNLGEQGTYPVYVNDFEKGKQKVVLDFETIRKRVDENKSAQQQQDDIYFGASG